MQVTVPERTDDHGGGRRRSASASPALLPPRPEPARRLPRVHRGGGGPAQPGGLLRLPGGRGHEGHDLLRRCSAGCAATSSSCSSTTTRRTARPASATATASCRTWPTRWASASGSSRASASASPVDVHAAGPARPREVHPLRPLRAGLRRDPGRLQPVSQQAAGSSTVVAPAHVANMADSVCIQCGQCVNVCPTAAFVETAITGPVLRGPGEPRHARRRADRPVDPRGHRRGLRLRPGHAGDRQDGHRPAPAGLREGVRHQLRRRPDDRRGVRRVPQPAPAERAAAADHLLLAGLDQLHGEVLPGADPARLDAAGRR